MLGKLIKHEFRATARVFGILFLVVIAAAVLAGFSFILLDSVDMTILNVLAGLIIAAFICSVFASIIGALVISVSRFHKNLLSDEGYLTLTLPVSLHQIIWSKLIVSTVWYLASYAVAALGMLIAFSSVMTAVDPESWRAFWSELFQVFPKLDAGMVANFLGYAFELLLILLLSCFASSLLFYAAMAVGYGFARHKAGMSVLFFFVFQFAVQLISSVLMLTSVSGMDYFSEIPGAGQIHVILLVLAGSVALYCGAFYLITWLSLKNRLNLE